MPAQMPGGGGGPGTGYVDTTSLAGVAAASGGGTKKKKAAAAKPPQPKITPSPTGQVNVSAPPKEVAGPVAQVKAPKPISQGKYLAGDVAYNDYLAQNKKALADLRAQQYADTNQHELDYESQVNSLNENKSKSLASLLEDYSSRGLAQSGLYSQAYGDLNQQYSDQLNGLTDNDEFAMQMQQALLAMQDQQTQGTNAAKQAALARYAASLTGG